MKTNYFKYITSIAIVFAMINNAYATTKFNYQGEIIYNGAPANDEFIINFRLYNVISGGNFLTTNSITTTITDGILNVELDFGDSYFTSQDLWLEIKISRLGDTTSTILTPRVPFNTSPYSIQASYVTDNSIDSASIINNSITGNDIADLTINGNKIINNTLSFDKIAQNGVSDGDIIQYSSTSSSWESTALTQDNTPWTSVSSGIFYQGNVGIGTGNSFIPNSPLDIRNILNNKLFSINFDGTITRSTQTRFLTLGYQAFTPERSSFKYAIDSSGTTTGLSNVESGNTTVSLYAPILLPHGVKITKFELLSFDNDAANQVTARIKQTSFTTNNVSITHATISSGAVPGGGIVSSNTLNLNYFTTGVYYVFITLPKPGIVNTELIFSAVKITYEIDEL